MSEGTNVSINALLQKLQEPLPDIGGFLPIMWELDDSSLMDLNAAISVEYIKCSHAKLPLISNIQDEITEILEERRMSVLEKRPTITKKRESRISLKLEDMTHEEILEQIRCKCLDIRAKFGKKSEAKSSEKLEECKEEEFGEEESSSSTSSSSESSKSFQSFRSRSSADIICCECEEEEKEFINCKEFMNIKDYAIYFIDDLLNEAQEKVSSTQSSTNDEGEREEKELAETVKEESESESQKEISTKSSDYTSPSYILIKNFTPKAGRELILEIICTWNLKKNWTYCIDFKFLNSDTCADFYIYEVKWSLPTMSYPIPQMTASVFFIIEASRVKSKECPVTVTYHFETERYNFTLEDEIQHEIFLDNIMQCKLDFFRNLRI